MLFTMKDMKGMKGYRFWVLRSDFTGKFHLNKFYQVVQRSRLLNNPAAQKG
jgi:hypothetical protein